VLGEAVLAVISQAPAATDDIDYAIVDPFYGREFAGERPVLAFVDAHNSYDNDTGDITYGSPVHRRLARDLEEAVAAALAAARPGPIRIGTAVRGGYSVAAHGIGSQGIRVLAVEAAGARTAYVLIDANNLLVGFRRQILDALADRVDAAEVMTTDNHVVHEVDGHVNALGERYPADRLLEDIRWTVDRALAELTAVAVAAGAAPVPAVRVLGPGYTTRLLTSLHDTLDIFRSALLISFLLMVTASAALVVLVR
jgi:putative membrane protein